MIKTIGREGWRRIGAIHGATDAWWSKGYGIALLTSRGWVASNGIVPTDGMRPIEPSVGPFPSAQAAIVAYDAALDAWLARRRTA